MPLSVESPEQAEALVNTLQIGGASLSDANLSSLSSSDLEQLADLQAELESINASEIDSGVDQLEVKPMLDGDLVPEIGEQEVVIEADESLEVPGSPDEILPDCRDRDDQDAEDEDTQLVKFDGTAVAPPPLRPLTIAPKPQAHKLPMALKTVVGGGQQIVLIQSPGGGNTVSLGGQQIKLLSSQGQTVSIPGIQNMQKNIVQLRAVPKPGTGDATALQNLQGIKKIIPQPKQMKVLGPNTGDGIMTTKTITLAQAQQMGLVQKISPQSPGKIMVNKPIQAKTIKVVPQVKSPTKILPAPVQLQKIQTKEGMQRVIIKQGTTQLKAVNTTATTGGPVNQVIRLPAGQTLTSTAGQIHQIQVPGKGVQYIRFMTSSSAGTPSTVTLSTASASQAAGAINTATGVTVQAKPNQKAQVVPVAGITVQRTKVGVPQQQNQIIKVGEKSVSYKVVPLSAAQTRPVAPKPVVSGQRLLIPATSSQVKPTQTIATIPAATLSQIQNAIMPSGNNVSQIVMLPAQYVQQIQNSTPKVAVTAKTHSQKPPIKTSPSQAKDTHTPSPSLSSHNTSNTQHETNSTSPESGSYARPLEPNGIRPRKPCNCTKSLCLKLYCDCFANGEFCHLCNCMNCYNNLDKEEERQRAIRNCLERNPNAFRPKIGKGKDSGESSVRKHTKGCNCKRSGCLKNYCECYEAKIACSSNCKCVGCRNIEDSMEKKNVRPLAPMPDAQLQVVPTAKKQERDNMTSFRQMVTQSVKLPSTYMTSEVIEATNQCMIAQADEAERNMMSEELGARLILEEFGRCLVQIIECSSQATSTTGNNT